MSANKKIVVHAPTLVQVRDALTKVINEQPEAAGWDWYGSELKPEGIHFGTSFCTLLSILPDPEPEGGAA